MNKKMELVECRYNPNHIVKKSRIEIHEQKCPDRLKKQNEYKLCPYNPRHHIKKELFEKHKLECENRPKISIEEEKEIEKARDLNDMATEQEQIQYARMKYYKDCIQEPEITGISQNSMRKNKKKRDKIIKKKFEEIAELDSKNIVKYADGLDQDNNNDDNPHEIDNFEGDLDFDIENDNINEEYFYKYNPNDEDKDINKYSANIIIPKEIEKILKDK